MGLPGGLQLSLVQGSVEDMDEEELDIPTVLARPRFHPNLQLVHYMARLANYSHTNNWIH